MMPMPSCVRAASSYNGPEFFKVFLPSFSSYQMEIPPAFLNHFKGKLPSKAILKDHTGKSWHVDFEELDEDYFFMNGWQAFVDDHLLEYGDFLVFQYLGNCIFNVKTFGKNGCTKNFMETVDHLVSHITIKDELDIDQTERRLTVGHFVPVAAIKDESNVDQTETNTTGASFLKLTQVESKGRTGEAKKRAAKFRSCPSKSEVTKYDASKYPFHEFTLTRWSLYHVHIPKSLTNIYHITMGPKLLIEDQRGNQWPVKIHSRNGRIFLGRGWSDCRSSNNMEIGVKCRLEFVLSRRNTCRKMNLKIIRSARKNRGV